MFAETKLGQVFCDLVPGLCLGHYAESHISQPDLILLSDQPGKGCFRALPVVIPQQFHVAHIGHLTIYCRWPRNQTFNFSIFYCRARTRVQVLFIRKRFRCIGTALNNAARVATAHNIREMSWTAPALWRFDRGPRQTNGLFYFLHHQHCDRLATRHKSEAKLFKCLVYAIQFLIFHVGFLAV